LPKLSRLANQIQKSRHKTNEDLEDLLEQIPDLETLRQRLGEKWSDFEYVVEEIKNKRKDIETIWDGLPPRLQKAIAGW